MKVPKDNILTETDDIKILLDRLNIGRFGVVAEFRNSDGVL